MKESAIEREGRKRLLAAGYPTEKLGVRGLPDNLVIFEPRMHFWLEWKQPGGQLTAAQKRRIPKLRSAGEWVAVIDDYHDAVVVARSAVRHAANGFCALHPLFYAPPWT